MAYLGRKGASAALTTADIPDNSITTAKIVDDNVTAAKIPAGAVSSDVLYLENNTSTQTLSGTYSTERLYFNDSYQLTGNVTVTGHLALGSIADEDIVITQDSTERTITGAGTLEAGELLSSKETDLTGMTGELANSVQDNITRLGTVTSGSIGSGVTGFTGVKMVDVWRMTSDQTVGGGAVYSGANWERLDDFAQGDGTNAVIGGSVKMAFDTSTGYWTFPSTGVYECVFHTSHYLNNTTPTPNCYIRIYSRISGTDADLTFGGGNLPVQYYVNRTNITAIFRVADVTTHFVWSRWDATAGQCIAEGSANKNYTWWKFIRLGDL